MKLHFLKVMLGCTLTTMVISANSASAKNHEHRHQQVADKLGLNLSNIVEELNGFWGVQSDQDQPDPEQNPELQGRLLVIIPDITNNIEQVSTALEKIGLNENKALELKSLLTSFFIDFPIYYGNLVYFDSPIEQQQAVAAAWLAKGEEIEGFFFATGGIFIQGQFQELVIEFTQAVQANSGELVDPADGVNPDNPASEGAEAERLDNQTQRAARRLGHLIAEGSY